MHYAGWLTIPLLLCAQTALARDAAQDEREILRVEAELCRAFKNGDAAALRRYLDETFTLTDSRGAVTDLAQNVDEVKRREPRYEVFRNHSQKVRLYGDAAITTGITSVKGIAGGTPFAADFQFTDTWVYRDGAWKMVASHASRLEARKPE
jgi:ketosteroid isomerase-like protein